MKGKMITIAAVSSCLKDPLGSLSVVYGETGEILQVRFRQNYTNDDGETREFIFSTADNTEDVEYFGDLQWDKYPLG